jgi:hypothetical protein
MIVGINHNAKDVKMEQMILRPDAKGRINLGDLAKGVSSYRVNVSENGNLILIPYAEIPFSEKWIFENEDTLEKVKQHIGLAVKQD